MEDIKNFVARKIRFSCQKERNLRMGTQNSIKEKLNIGFKTTDDLNKRESSFDGKFKTKIKRY